ncbi:MAG: acetolactate decarboxylase [Firmicutes bacterium]|nr:acetolactate decarboxylase [Bacillota bacterium]
MKENSIYQVSTLQALVLGYTRPVITVEELLEHGDTGLGTFEGVGGEMIVVDGHCYCAANDGSVTESDPKTGVPFAAVTKIKDGREIDLDNIADIEELKTKLDIAIEEDFGLNSMHIVKIVGRFKKVSARSEAEYKSHHVSLKEILSKSQKDFFFNDIDGTLVCVYYPDYMDSINAKGWHLHFVSDDHSCGGHVFDVSVDKSKAVINKISNLNIQLPTEPVFDTYSLKSASNDEIKEVEQGK